MNVGNEKQDTDFKQLKEPKLWENNMVTKERRVEIMDAARFNQAAIRTWQKKFAKRKWKTPKVVSVFRD